jgi:hypothetical protein
MRANRGRVAGILPLLGLLVAGCSDKADSPEETPALPGQVATSVLTELARFDDSLGSESKNVRFTRVRRLSPSPDEALRGVTDKYCIAINYSCRFPRTADLWLDTYLWFVAERDSAVWTVRRNREAGGCCE